MNIHHAPYRNVIQITDSAAIRITHLQIQHHHTILIVQYTDRHAIRCSQQGIGHVPTCNSGSQSILLHIFSHHGLTRRFPVILNRIGIHIGTTTHNRFGLMTQIAQYGRIRPRKLHLNRMRSCNREVVFANSDIGLRERLSQLFSYDRDLFEDRFIILAIDR